MKKLVSSGVTLVVFARYRPVANVAAPSVRVFPLTAPALDPAAPFNVDLHFGLADGHTYSYTYQGLNDIVADQHRAELLQRKYTPGVIEPAGGKLFNSYVRSTCIGKAILF